MITKNKKFKRLFVIFLMGPTACGKSMIALKLRKLIPVELISVDSALVYRDMNIGTAKPTKSELLYNPYHLIDIKDPMERYSVSEFQSDALEAIQHVISKDKVPLLVGGTMFYFKVLLEGLPKLPPSNYDVRSYLYSMKNNKNFLHNKLKEIDVTSSKRIHPNDIQRILRALEIFYISGKTLTELTMSKNYKFPYDVIQFSIIPYSKDWLKKNIYIRFHKMLFLGFQNEVENLLRRGDLHIDLPSIRCVGYRQMWNYLLNSLSYDEMIFQSISATKKLAKNQLTWLKNWKNIYELKNFGNIDNLSHQIVKIIKNTYF
ncbi:MAG: tRNA (adenosine(37)-N6)-dimethylallyltransferase MiaA [Buchnera aphidicola (Nurudea shiraii)]